MAFDHTAYGDEVAAILALDGRGQKLMPLTHGACSSPKAQAALQGASEWQLFPSAPSPEAAFAGLYLYFGCWKEAHEISQNISTREGSYWHAIVHRQEPDGFNSGYWFRQVGDHPIFSALHDSAAAIGVNLGPRWNPEAFIEFCDRARSEPGSTLERHALEVQRAEWQLLFDYCAAL